MSKVKNKKRAINPLIVVYPEELKEPVLSKVSIDSADFSIPGASTHANPFNLF